MFEDEKRHLEEAQEHHKRVMNAFLDKTELQAIKCLIGIIVITEIGAFGLIFCLVSNIGVLATTLGTFAFGDALLTKKLCTKSKEYKEKYQDLKELSLEELKSEEQISKGKVEELRNELEFEMSASTKEKDARNMQQKSQTISEDYIIEKGNTPNKEKHMVKCLGIKRS